MLGQIILPLITIFGNMGGSVPLENLTSDYCDTAMYQDPRDGTWQASPFGSPLPCEPIACAPTFCESYEVISANGYLLCFDSDESYPPGHWSYDVGPDQGDIQITVEY